MTDDVGDVRHKKVFKLDDISTIRLCLIADLCYFFCNESILSKVLISPTKYKYQASKFFVIFDFYHKLEG